MDARSGFEARAVIAPRRSGLGRATLLVPVVVLVGIVLVGVNGARPAHPTAAVPLPTNPASPVRPPEPPFPAEVLGFNVQPLDAIDVQGLGLDTVVAVAGWYAPMLVADCPPLAAQFRAGPFPNGNAFVDPYAYCARSGVFHASRPEADAPVVIDSTEGVGSRSAGLASVAASMVEGVVASPELNAVGGDAAEAVVLGRFVYSGSACGTAAACRALLIDYVAWTPGS
ncbi:MAG TPA: hypothetical protein VE011_10430 [Candidatus Dormibacteraeota bacterium]|nr:hypothetical protein [Candidatus Dormibacteraeota bacterium]